MALCSDGHQQKWLKTVHHRTPRHGRGMKMQVSGEQCLTGVQNLNDPRGSRKTFIEVIRGEEGKPIEEGTMGFNGTWESVVEKELP